MASLGQNNSPLPEGGLPDAAGDIGPLFLRWWQYGPLPSEDMPVACRPVSSSQGQVSNQLVGVSEQLVAHLATALPQYADSSVEPEKAEVKSISQLRLASYLDAWMESVRIASDLDVFEKALANSDRIFELTWPSGRSIVAPLSELCAARIAHYLVCEPNPLFFSIPQSAESKNHSEDRIYFDPRWLLPTVTARALRDRLLLGEQIIYVEPCQLYLASAFLPELLGQMVIIPTAEDEVSEIPSEALRSPSSEQLILGRKVARFSLLGSLVRIHFLRYGLLGLAHMVKRILEPSAKYGSWQLRLIQRFTGPWSSRKWFRRSDFRQLKKLANWAGG